MIMLTRILLLFLVWCFAGIVQATDMGKKNQTRSRLLATGGVSSIEGTAGGGIVPMAVLAGYGAQEEQGGAAFASSVDTADYQLTVVGASWSWRNRIEISFAEQELTHDSLTAALNLPSDSIR